MRRVFRVFTLTVAFALLGAATAAVADEADVQRAFEARHPGVKVDKVTKTRFGGLYEVLVGDEIVYTDEKADYLFIGRLIDARTRIDLTEERLEKLTAVDLKWSDLPLDQAVKTVRGNGKRVMAVFSDPHCPACRQLDSALQNVTDATIYTFLYPVIHPELRKHSEAIWRCRATVRTQAQTGVEMEALAAVEITLLTIYDMCKAVDRGMTITDIGLLSKTGGKSGDWRRP